MINQVISYNNGYKNGCSDWNSKNINSQIFEYNISMIIKFIQKCVIILPIFFKFQCIRMMSFIADKQVQIKNKKDLKYFTFATFEDIQGAEKTLQLCLRFN